MEKAKKLLGGPIVVRNGSMADNKEVYSLSSFTPVNSQKLAMIDWLIDWSDREIHLWPGYQQSSVEGGRYRYDNGHLDLWWKGRTVWGKAKQIFFVNLFCLVPMLKWFDFSFIWCRTQQGNCQIFYIIFMFVFLFMLFVLVFLLYYFFVSFYPKNRIFYIQFFV